SRSSSYGVPGNPRRANWYTFVPGTLADWPLLNSKAAARFALAPTNTVFVNDE
ncbi:hypothetical protein C0992_001277, partial [Termitomyces sp. T32_za158]